MAGTKITSKTDLTPKVVQVYEIVNALAQQSLGMVGLEPTEASFVAVRKEIMNEDSTQNKDSYLRALWDLVGRTVYAIREYEETNVTMDMEPIEWGAIMRKFSFTMPQAQENPTWNPQTDPASSLTEKYPTEMRQYFFSNISAWEVPLTIPDVQLFTAFENAESMLSFLSCLFLNQKNAMKLAYENLGNTARGVLIGSVLNNKSAVTAVNVLAEYNKAYNTTLKKATCLYDPDFYRFTAQRVKMTAKRMHKFSTTFNNVGQERHTPTDALVLEVLSEFASGFDTYLQSEVFHNELTKLPLYEEVIYWQGSGKNWSFDDTSSIDLKVTSDEGTNVNYQFSGIIAVLRDRDSVGTTIRRRRTTSFVNPHDELTNYWDKAEMCYFVDNSENAVVFYIADVEEPTPTPTPDTPTGN